MGEDMGETRSFRDHVTGRYGLSRAALGATILFAFGCGGSQNGEEDGGSDEGSTPSLQEVASSAPVERFGLPWEEFIADSGEVRNGQSLSHLLSPFDIGASTIMELAQTAKPTFDVRNIKVGRPWWVLSDQAGTPHWFIYEKSRTRFVVFSLGDTLGAQVGDYPMETRTKRVTGTIEQNLSVDLERLGEGMTLALAMANVYAWTVDFSRLQKGDSFDVLFEQDYVKGSSAGFPRIIACHFGHGGRDIPAYRYDQGEGDDFFDDSGSSLRKAFLKAPIEFSRISSHYNMRRFHPVLKRVKPHLGTDYAAKHGTPIVAVGDGVITKSSYTAGNGKYVKIRHNSTYETQYLHMSRRAVTVGQRVRQGETIGYVGSTGLATGPHVCFRFWKNGRQVNHLREEFPPSTPIDAAHKTDFEQTIEELRRALLES